MRKFLLGAILAGSTLVAMAPAEAAQGCGRGFHRGPYGRCFPNRGPGPVAVVPGPLIVDRYYAGRGYWDGRRYWQNRRRWHGGWRYY